MSDNDNPNTNPTPSSPNSAFISSDARASGTAVTAGASKIVIAITNPALILGAIAADENTGANTISPLNRTSTSTAAVRYCGQSSINPLASPFIILTPDTDESRSTDVR